MACVSSPCRILRAISSRSPSRFPSQSNRARMGGVLVRPARLPLRFGAASRFTRTGLPSFDPLSGIEHLYPISVRTRTGSVRRHLPKSFPVNKIWTFRVGKAPAVNYSVRRYSLSPDNIVGCPHPGRKKHEFEQEE